jgi:hypothetical protein
LTSASPSHGRLVYSPAPHLILVVDAMDGGSTMVGVALLLVLLGAAARQPWVRWCIGARKSRTSTCAVAVTQIPAKQATLVPLEVLQSKPPDAADARRWE